MKRLCALLLCLVLLLPLPALGQAGSDGAVVNNPNPADRLHLRGQPSVTAPSLGKYYNGTLVRVLEDTVGEWVKVGVGYPDFPLEGFMQKKYLAFDFNGTADKVKSAMPEYMSHSSAWELYRQPDKNGAYDTYGQGEALRLMGFTDTWWHIAIMRDGKIYRTGFVQANNSLESPQTAVVSNPNAKDRLHLRVSSSSTAQSLGKYYNGVKVQVIGYNAETGWSKVRVGLTEGYMLDEYLAFGDDATKVKNAMPAVRLKTDKVNLRERASLQSKSLGQYALGTSVKVWGLCGDWLHVEIGSKSGYMLASMLAAIPGEGPGSTVQPVSGKAAKLKANANFRESASYTGTVLAYLGKGTKVTVQSQSGDWYYVRIGTTEAYGWILKSMVSIE